MLTLFPSPSRFCVSSRSARSIVNRAGTARRAPLGVQACLSVRASELSQQPRPPSTSSSRFSSLIDGVFTVQGTIVTVASPELVYQLLAPELSGSVFANIESSRVTRGPGTAVQVEQVCRWRFLALSGTFDATLDIVERPELRSVAFALRRSAFMRQMDGDWRVVPAADGSGGCTVEHKLSVRPSFDLPAALAQYVKTIFVDQEASILEDLRKEVDRRLDLQQ